MKKILTMLLIFSLIGVCTSACSNGTRKSNLIQSKRKFATYVESQQQVNKNTIDLSEGPKLKYDADLGPRSLNFDIKIVDPY